ncbi:TLC domain-containing protein 1 isoform X3 [Ambystoma mexicanum]|uniref:TLC domain-containing protein 1 isoform X3 n=1 Tax=Ambystoma mexicanum TaxID=8296 RepID=UPI0037E711A3
MALLHSPLLLVVCSALAFRVLSRLLHALPVPKLVEKDWTRTWRWRNLSVSMVHSLLTGPGAVLCVLQFPDILTNVKDCSPKPAYLLLCASLGYFLMDAADIIMNGQAKASWEFLLHHALVISSFTYAAFTGRYVAGTTIALFVEVNSIFLHTRLMLKLCSAQDSPLYRVNRYLNLLTFISFRLGAHAFLTWYLLWNFLTLPHGTFFMTTVGTIDIVILVYFYRLVRADFFPKTKHLQGVRETYSEKKFLTD